MESNAAYNLLKFERAFADEFFQWLQQQPLQHPKNARRKEEYTRFAGKLIYRTATTGRYGWGQHQSVDAPPYTLTGFPPELQRLVDAVPLLRDGSEVKANHVIIMLYSTGDHHIDKHRDRQIGAKHPTTGKYYRTGSIAANTDIANAIFCDSPRVFRVYNEAGGAIFDRALDHGEVLVLKDNAHTTHEVPEEPGWEGNRYSVVLRYMPETVCCSFCFISFTYVVCCFRTPRCLLRL